MHRQLFSAVLAATALCVAGAAAEEATNDLTLDQALDLARRRAPALIAARAATEVARGRRSGIYRWTRENPAVSVDAGPRFAEDGDRSVDVDVGIEQTFELGGRGAARVAMADAEIDRASSSAKSATVRLLGEVASSFVDVLHREERRAVARDDERLASERLRVAERRAANGDVGALDVNVAAVALAHARARSLAADAAHLTAVADLRLLLDLDRPVAVRGDLRAQFSPTLDELLARAAERPDLKALQAEVERADAELRLGRASAWPDLGVRLGYEREEGADIALGGIRLTLPFVDHGQAIRAVAAARRAAASARLEAGRRAANEEVRSSFAAHALLVRAADGLAAEALPRLAENETLARRSYELGRLPLGELLVAERELIAARRTYVDLERDAALAGIALRVRSGDLQ